MNLENKTIVITGGGQGLGRTMAISFAQSGANIALIDLNEELLQETAKLVEQSGVSAKYYLANVSDETQVETTFKQINDDFNGIDGLINNAGILKDSTLVKMEEDQFDDVINVNLKGVYLCTHAAAEVMKEQGSGVILSASSVVAHNGNFGQTNYVATKTGVIGMTKVWARELGKEGIRVNAVAPGFITTEMTAQMPEKIIKMMEAKVPLKRWGNVEDVANVYCFLASDEASYINGTVLNVDGGVVV